MTENDQSVPRSTAKPVCSICEKIVDDDCDGTDEKKDDDGIGVAAAGVVGRCEKQQQIAMKQSVTEFLDSNLISSGSDAHNVAEGTNGDDKELHIAPMLDYSKREFRKLFSILSTRLVVWTDMVVDETIAHSDRLDDIIEPDRDLVNRQVCQIGGNSPTLCGNATQVVEVIYGYDEVNLNIDCPSDRVSGEREFGASLMKKVEVAYAVLESMQHNVTPEKKTPVSIKCRIGVDDWDNFDFISSFIECLMPVCTRFYLHARKCVLNGLYSARQNRSVPPINYPRVYALCRKFPDVEIWINGGIRNLVQAKKICYGSSAPEHSEHNHFDIPCRQCQLPHGSCMAPPYEAAPRNLRGCMMGRAAIDNPAIFWDADRYFYGLERNPCQNRRQVLEQYAIYLEVLYPKRCCDVDEEMTHQLPVPKINQLYPYCPTCRDKYRTENEKQEEMEGVVTTGIKQKKKAKIHTRIIGRSFKPIRGLFYALPGSKVFLHTLDKLGRDASIRNCGPGYILRRVMEEIPSELLDQNFVSSEDRDDA